MHGQFAVPLVVLAAASPGLAQTPAKRPNIVLLLTDDKDLALHE